MSDSTKLAAAMLVIEGLRLAADEKLAIARVRSRKYYYGPSHELNKKKRLAYYYANKQTIARKILCTNCGKPVAFLHRNKHKLSAKCQRNTLQQNKDLVTK